MTLDYLNPNKLTDNEIKERLLAAAVHSILQPHLPKAHLDDFDDLPVWTIMKVSSHNRDVYHKKILENCLSYDVFLMSSKPVCKQCMYKLRDICLYGYTQGQVGVYFSDNLGDGNCYFCGVDWAHERIWG